MELVYVLGTGSRWGNRELRYSLRSVETHLKDAGRVYVVGEDPGFLSKEVILIRYPDMYGSQNADGNMIAKVLRACKEQGLSDDFIYMNDDGYFLVDMECKDIPYFHKGLFGEVTDEWVKKNEGWRKRFRKTVDALRKAGLPTYHYDHHNPVVMNKARFMEVMGRFNYAEGIGLCIKSLYCNSVLKEHHPRTNQKARFDRKGHSRESIEQEVAGKLCMSHDDRGLNRALKEWIRTRWPKMSRYEAWPDTLDLEGAPKRRTYKLR